ncbi:hypothetical protein F383_02372 [Gossypium arboreum]|uniref:Uncharacterized protein n=1 Tax=Gossypium arboreum TaxID=29729 RepID=A0A0B0NY42_GOSAR|nr:hypothetical protein F383_02372 [Gossypium arboreum]
MDDNGLAFSEINNVYKG